MRQVDYGKAAGLVFLTVALVHAIRAISGWEAEVNGLVVPIWFSWLVALVMTALGLSGLKYGK